MSFEQRLEKLQQWLSTGNNNISNKLYIKSQDNGQRGVYTQASINVNEQLIKVNSRYCINHHTVSKMMKSFKETSDERYQVYSRIETQKYTSFQLVGLFLVLERRCANSWWKPFLDILPTEFDIPALWLITKDSKFDFLSKTAKAHAQKIHQRMTRDFEVVSPFGITLEEYSWAYCCINSRCLYMDIGFDPEENFTMVPFVDFLNHDVTEHCCPKVDRFKNFCINSLRKYEAGDEVFLSYGAHSNEFLFNEYGFVVKDNPWDYLDISEVILSLLSDEQKTVLQRINYLGEYTLNRTEVSFRTQVALAVLSNVPHGRLNAIIGGTTQFDYHALLTEVLDKVCIPEPPLQIDTYSLQCIDTINRSLAEIKRLNE